MIKITARCNKNFDTQFWKHAGFLERHGLKGNKKAKHYTAVVADEVANTVVSEAITWPAWSIDVVKI